MLSVEDKVIFSFSLGEWLKWVRRTYSPEATNGFELLRDSFTCLGLNRASSIMSLGWMEWPNLRVKVGLLYNAARILTEL